MNPMTTAQVFDTGNGQAVRLPSGFHFDVDEVAIRQIGEMVVLLPKDSAKSLFLQSLQEFTPDFMESREQPQEVDERREW